MKFVKAASLALMIGLYAPVAGAQLEQQAAEAAAQSKAPAPMQGETAAQKAAQAIANTNAGQTPKVDPVEVKHKAKEHLMYIFQYSMTLPEKERKPYTDLLFAGGLIIHKMDRGLVKPDEFDAKLKELDKFYEGDRKLTDKEAKKWMSSIQPLTAPPRRY